MVREGDNFVKMIPSIYSMALKALQKHSRMYIGPFVNMSWDSGYKSFVANTRLGPVFEPQLPHIAMRFRGEGK